MPIYSTLQVWMDYGKKFFTLTREAKETRYILDYVSVLNILNQNKYHKKLLYEINNESYTNLINRVLPEKLYDLYLSCSISFSEVDVTIISLSKSM